MESLDIIQFRTYRKTALSGDFFVSGQFDKLEDTRPCLLMVSEGGLLKRFNAAYRVIGGGSYCGSSGRSGSVNFQKEESPDRHTLHPRFSALNPCKYHDILLLAFPHIL